MVLRYFIGGVVVIGFLIFLFRQFKSVIDVLRERRKSKSSEEVKKNTPEQSSIDVSEKEVDK